MSIPHFLRCNNEIVIIIRIGKSAPKPKPVLRDSPDTMSEENLIDIKLINHGPSVHPVSPESARTLYIEPPPLGKSLAARLSVAGHIMLTVIPVIAQVKSEIIGLLIKHVPR